MRSLGRNLGAPVSKQTWRPIVGGLLIFVGLLHLLNQRPWLWAVVASAAIILAGADILGERRRLFGTIICGLGMAMDVFVLLRDHRYLFSDYFPTWFRLISLVALAGGFAWLLWPSPIIPVAATASVNSPSPGDDSWREWLLASLRDAGVQSTQDRFSSGALAISGVILLVVVLVSASALLRNAWDNAAYFASRGYEYTFVPVLIAQVVWVIFALVVLSHAKNVLFRQIWRSRARNAELELGRADSRRPVLYLRSFEFDRYASKGGAWLERITWFVDPTKEQKICAVLAAIGPVIAIGRPNERLPLLGAARFYASDDRWQEKVDHVVKVCQLVLVATGHTQSIQWELQHLIRHLPPEKLVLWAHPHVMQLDAMGREKEWSKFLSAVDGLFPWRLPQRLGETRFLHFDAAFKPIPVGPPPKQLSRPESALHAVLQARGLAR